MGKTRRPKGPEGQGAGSRKKGLEGLEGLGAGSRKKQDVGLEWCEVCECEIPKNPKSLAEHFNSESQHKRKEKLHLLGPYFAKHSLDYFPAGTTYYCQICAMGLPNHVEKLQYHLVKYAAKHGLGVRVQPIPFPATTNEVFVRNSMTLVDFASTNDELNEQLVRLHRVVSPITVMESGLSPSQIFDLRCDVFTPVELEVVTQVVSYLEKHGNSVSRSEDRGSSRMCLWGMRSTHGNTGWYAQDHHPCYSLSEDFATYVCGILKRSYGKIFEHLESIPSAEGFHGNDARIGGGPFSSFSTSRDFNSRPQKDEDDYSYGFIFWLQEGTVPKGLEPTLFAFPQVGVSFVPRHGDVLCFQPSQYLHCTRRLWKTDLLEVAFFQKCSLYRQLRELIHPKGSGSILFHSSDGKTNIVETREGFLKKKENYQQHLQESTLSISEFMGPR